MKGFARADLLVVLAIIAVVVGLFTARVPGGLLGFIRALAPASMPNLATQERIGETRPHFCSETQIIARIVYNKPGSGTEFGEYVAFYLSPSDIKVGRPYIVIEFKTDQTGADAVKAVYLDLDRDGRADATYTSIEELIRENPRFQSGPCGIFGGAPVKRDA